MAQNFLINRPTFIVIISRKLFAELMPSLSRAEDHLGSHRLKDDRPEKKNICDAVFNNRLLAFPSTAIWKYFPTVKQKLQLLRELCGKFCCFADRASQYNLSN